MITLLFWIFFAIIFGKVLIFAVKAAWSIFKIIIWLVFLPVILIGMVLAGLIYIAIPILALVGLVTLLQS